MYRTQCVQKACCGSFCYIAAYFKQLMREVRGIERAIRDKECRYPDKSYHAESTQVYKVGENGKQVLSDLGNSVACDRKKVGSSSEDNITGDRKSS